LEAVSFSGLNQLLLLLGGLDRLGQPERYALNVALEFSEGLACELLAVANAALAPPWLHKPRLDWLHKHSL